MAIELIATIKPKNAGDFPMVEDVDLKGGFRLVADETERLAIQSARRQHGMLVYQVDTQQYWRLEADLVTWTEVLLGGSGASLILWDSAKTWAHVYSETQAAGGACYVLVLNDSTKEMTPDPGGPTDLSNVYFVGLRDQDGGFPTIDVDSLGVGGFLLGGDRSLHSKDINWQTYYEIVSGPGVNCFWELDGGSLTSATTESAYRSLTVTLSLRNGVVLDGSSCTTGLFAIRGGGNGVALGGCRLGPKTFYASVGTPPFPTMLLATDAGTYIDPAAVAGTGLSLSTTLLDLASNVSFDDSSTPLSYANTVQGVLDWLKACVSPPGHMRVDYWAGGETWQQVYERFVVNADGGILFVWHDGATPLAMTPNPLGDTDLNNIWFVGLPQSNGTYPTIQVDPSNLGTFVLPGAGNLHSKDLHWQFPSYLVCDASIYDETTVELDGGSITTVAASQGIWMTKSVRMLLQNGAQTVGLNCLPGRALVEATSAAKSSAIRVGSLAVLGHNSIMSAVAHPLDLYLSADCELKEPGYSIGPIVETRALIDRAIKVQYDNVTSGLTATNVQAAIDELEAEKVTETRQVSAGTGLSGGGDLTADRTISANFGSTVGTICQGNDARLSDARTPTSHAASHNAGGGDALAIDAAAGTGSLRTLSNTATSACAGNDSRLSDARTPTAHAASHNAGGGDALAIDAAAGTGSLRTLGTSATSACAGNDSRLSDARTPTAHATTHVTGGSDVIANAIAGGASGLLSGSDKSKLDSLDTVVTDSSDVVLRPVVSQVTGATRAMAQTYVGAQFECPRRCSFANAYLRLTLGTVGAIIRITIYQQANGNSGTGNIVATGTFTLTGAGAQNITIPLVGTLKRGLCYVLVGIDTATAATMRVYTNPSQDLLNTNVPAGKAPLTFTTAITVNSSPPGTFDPATQGTATTSDVAPVIRIGA